MCKIKNLIVIFGLLAFSTPTIANPKGKARSGHKRPPQEALQACQSKSSGETCSFENQRGAATGTCFTPSSDKPLACRPDGHRQDDTNEGQSSTQ